MPLESLDNCTTIIIKGIVKSQDKITSLQVILYQILVADRPTFVIIFGHPLASSGPLWHNGIVALS